MNSPLTNLVIPARELFGRSVAQINAKNDILEHWRLSKLSSADFVRIVDERYNSYLINHATDRDILLYRKSLIAELNTLNSTKTDCVRTDIEFINVRFDGEIDDKIGLFLIELPIKLIEKFINAIKADKYSCNLPYIDLTDLLAFYNNPNTTPFKNFDLNTYRYIHIPYNNLIVH